MRAGVIVQAYHKRRKAVVLKWCGLSIAVKQSVAGKREKKEEWYANMTVVVRGKGWAVLLLELLSSSISPIDVAGEFKVLAHILS